MDSYAYQPITACREITFTCNNAKLTWCKYSRAEKFVKTGLQYLPLSLPAIKTVLAHPNIATTARCFDPSNNNSFLVTHPYNITHLIIGCY